MVIVFHLSQVLSADMQILIVKIVVKFTLVQ